MTPYSRRPGSTATYHHGVITTDRNRRLISISCGQPTITERPKKLFLDDMVFDTVRLRDIFVRKLLLPSHYHKRQSSHPLVCFSLAAKRRPVNVESEFLHFCWYTSHTVREHSNDLCLKVCTDTSLFVPTRRNQKAARLLLCAKRSRVKSRREFAGEELQKALGTSRPRAVHASRDTPSRKRKKTIQHANNCFRLRLPRLHVATSLSAQHE